MAKIEVNTATVCAGLAFLVGMLTATAIASAWLTEVTRDIEDIEATQQKIVDTIVESGEATQQAITEASEATQQAITEASEATQQAIKEASEATQQTIIETSKATQRSVEAVQRSVDKLSFSATSQPRKSDSIRSASPTTLTEFGEKISREVGGKELAEELAPELASQVKGWIPYDIHEFAFHYFDDRASEDIGFRARVRTVAYDNAVHEWVVVNVLSIELRDVLLLLESEETQD